VLNGVISQEEDPERLLQLVDARLPDFDDVNVATAVSKLGKLCRSGALSRNIAADGRFRGIMLKVRDMCAEGLLRGRAVANIMHAVAKMSAAGKIATADEDIQGSLAALEKRAVLVVSDMQPQEVASWIWSYATLGWMPGPDARAVLEAAVVRESWGMKPQELSMSFGRTRNRAGHLGLRCGRRWRLRWCG
jgi:hypothetical protein